MLHTGGLPILNEEGVAITGSENSKVSWPADSAAASEVRLFSFNLNSFFYFESNFISLGHPVLYIISGDSWSEQMHTLPQFSPAPNCRTLWSCFLLVQQIFFFFLSLASDLCCSSYI